MIRLFSESIIEGLNVHSEFVFNDSLSLGRVVFRVMSQPRVGARVRKHFAYPELFRDHGPVLLQTFKSADEIRQHLTIGIDKPIKLVAVRRGMDAGCATILNPAHE